jgi:hypothetical protein
MARRLRRDEAIRLITAAALGRLTLEERAEQLEIMMLEDWDSHPLWSTIPSKVRKEFAQQREIKKPASDRYDPVLLLWLASGYAGARNEYLLACLRAMAHDVTGIDGEPVSLQSCPCCGYRTLNSRGNYEICNVCWWEDDGQDNKNANQARGGPNYGVSLTRARINHLKSGIYDPSREDLREFQEPCEKYERGRIFELAKGKRGVREPAAGWSSSLGQER